MAEKKYKTGEKLRYQYENFLSKGGGALFFSLLILFAVSFAVSVFARKIAVWVNPDAEIFPYFWEHIWLTFLQIIDPGAIMEDTASSMGLKLASILTTFLGIIIFSVLIAFITTKFEETLYNFRKGRSKVLESGHILILGNNERLLDILHELILANESEKDACVVILCDQDKEEMDDFLNAAIPIHERLTTRIVTRQGSPSSLPDLLKVNVAGVKSAIILADSSGNPSEEEKRDADAKTFKSILAVNALSESEEKIPIVAELLLKQSTDLIDGLSEDNVYVLDKDEILGRALVQTSLTSGLEMVYSEIFSFDGAEIYFYESDFAGLPFYEMVRHFEDGIPMGIYRGGKLILHPEEAEIMQEGDEVLILASDDSAVNFKKNEFYAPSPQKATEKRIPRNQRRQLILGWHTISTIIIREYADYLLEGSSVDVMLQSPSESVSAEIENLKKAHPQLSINLISGNPMNRTDLERVKPFDYDTVIILSQDESDYSAEKTDSDTLLILLLLREISKTLGAVELKTKLITQVLNSDNKKLIHQSDVDDFLISNQLVSMLFAQVSEEPRLKELYMLLFSEEGSEIYLKPAVYYFEDLPKELTFGDVIEAARLRGEICMGIQFNEDSRDPEKNFGVVLNLQKDQSIALSKDECLVVLSEDET